MTNAEKYKTAEARARAFNEYCHSRICNDCPAWGNDDSWNCRFSWLDLEAEEEKIEDCPYCGCKCEVSECGDIVYCVEFDCKYSSGQVGASRGENVAAHNRVARAVREAGKEEAK